MTSKAIPSSSISRTDCQSSLDIKFRIRKRISFGCADQFVTKTEIKEKTLATVDSKISALSIYSNQRDSQHKSAARE